MACASPEQIAEWPELAALEIAAAAADTAVRTLVASFPSLETSDFLLEHDDVTPQICLAAAALSALDAASIAIGQYRVHVEHLASARRLRPPPRDDLTF